MPRSTTRSVSVTTAYVSLPDVPGNEVSILNNTGAALLVRMRDGQQSGENLSLNDGQSVRLHVSATAAEIQISAGANASGVQVVID